MSEPMELFHNQVLLGSLTRYGYATPWAEAWLQPIDPATIARYAAIFAFRDWVEATPDTLSDAESDAHYLQELHRRGLNEAQVDAILDGWEIRMADGTVHAISILHIEEDGYLTWRW